jgi:hypothetical protein
MISCESVKNIQWHGRKTHLPFMAPFVFTRLINSVTTLLDLILPSSKVEAPEFWYTLPCVQRSVYAAKRLHIFLVSAWETVNRHPLTHPTFVSISFSIGHEFSLNILGSKRYTEADFPLGNVTGWFEAPIGVVDNLPIAAELISRYSSP